MFEAVRMTTVTERSRECGKPSGVEVYVGTQDPKSTLGKNPKATISNLMLNRNRSQQGQIGDLH